MEFTERMTETESSKRSKGIQIPFNDYENYGFRMTDRIDMGNDIGLSIQASYGHYCTPRKTLPFSEYTSMEIAIFVDGEFADIRNVTFNKELVKSFDEFQSGTVYAFVPVELIEKLYQELNNQ